MQVKRAPSRTHTYPVCRPPMHKACQHQRLWAYTHSRLTDADVHVVATALGITVSELMEAAFHAATRRAGNRR